MQYSSRTPWPKKKQMCAQEQFFTGKAGDMGKFPIAECSIHHELLGHKKKYPHKSSFSWVKPVIWANLLSQNAHS